MSKHIRIMLINEDELIRHVWRLMLEQENDMEVVSDYADAEEAFSHVEMLSPDIVLINSQMPGMDVIEATRRLKRNGLNYDGDVIILAESADYRAEALKAGAASYILKEITRTELVQIIRRIYGNGHRLEQLETFSEEARLVIPIPADTTERNRVERELRERNEQLDVRNAELQSQIKKLMAQQQELREKTRKLEAASRVRSEFVAHISHELRTPLNSIIGFSELMIDGVPGKVNEEQRQCLNDILGSGEHLLSLINNILDMSKIESGKMELKPADIALSNVVESGGSQVMSVIGPRKQSLDIAVEEKLPQVYADADKVRQVLLNLLSNAAKFTPDGGKLKVEAVRENNWCRVSVIDNGIGIKKEDQERIFEPFCQVDSSLIRENVGTGLGLSITREIIEKHGGRIWLESKYGKGSKFTFTLPLSKGIFSSYPKFGNLSRSRTSRNKKIRVSLKKTDMLERNSQRC